MHFERGGDVCNSDVIDVTFDSRSRSISRAKLETRETSIIVCIRIKIEIKVKFKIEKQARDSRDKLQSLSSRDCNCNRWISNPFGVRCFVIVNVIIILLFTFSLNFIFSICSREKRLARRNNMKEDVFNLFTLLFEFCFK